ncbi:phytanoyl-CoA dioxygenase family protein [Luminiphilus sp.]|nr:phytanoyl-CoA dioxygenase family protein [Luminiphilus sp.]
MAANNSQHGFTFPDLANYADVRSEPRLEDDVDLRPLCAAVRALDAEQLNQELSRLLTPYFIETGAVDHKSNKITLPPGARWIENLFTFFNFYKAGVTPTKSERYRGDLDDKGYLESDIDVGKLKSLIREDIDRLQQIADWLPPPGKFDRSVRVDEQAVAELQTQFESNGLVNAASRYMGRDMAVFSATLQISTPTDSHYKQFFYDCETLPDTIGMHIDPKSQVVKAMVYLEDVDIDSGPFSYVPGSHRWQHNAVQNLFGRAICTGNYCESPENRRMIFSLPAPLRVSFNFGRAIPPESDQATKLLREEKKFLGPAGSVILFDPGQGIHRGGICNRKPRYALQVQLR